MSDRQGGSFIANPRTCWLPPRPPSGNHPPSAYGGLGGYRMVADSTGEDVYFGTFSLSRLFLDLSSASQ